MCLANNDRQGHRQARQDLPPELSAHRDGLRLTPHGTHREGGHEEDRTENTQDRHRDQWSKARQLRREERGSPAERCADRRVPNALGEMDRAMFETRRTACLAQLFEGRASSCLPLHAGTRLGRVVPAALSGRIRAVPISPPQRCCSRSSRARHSGDREIPQANGVGVRSFRRAHASTSISACRAARTTSRRESAFSRESGRMFITRTSRRGAGSRSSTRPTGSSIWSPREGTK